MLALSVHTVHNEQSDKTMQFRAIFEMKKCLLAALIAWRDAATNNKDAKREISVCSCTRLSFLSLLKDEIAGGNATTAQRTALTLCI